MNDQTRDKLMALANEIHADELADVLEALSFVFGREEILPALEKVFEATVDTDEQYIDEQYIDEQAIIDALGEMDRSDRVFVVGRIVDEYVTINASPEVEYH